VRLLAEALESQRWEARILESDGSRREAPKEWSSGPG
jgi:hypothetical protein